MRTAPRHVHFYSVMNRKSSAAEAKLTMEKQLEIVRQKLILLTWLLKTGGRGRQMERWHGEENRILTWRILDQALVVHFPLVSEPERNTPHWLWITEVMATKNLWTLKCGHFLRRRGTVAFKGRWLQGCPAAAMRKTYDLERACLLQIRTGCPGWINHCNAVYF